MNLDYDMDARGDLPRYEYLYRRIRDDIAAGVVAPDDRLPSKRGLARRLGVSLITVENAYAQLIAEGYVIARERRGYYAAELPRPGALRPHAVSAARTAPGLQAPGAAAAGAHPGADMLSGAGSGGPSQQREGEGQGEGGTPLIADFSRPATPARSPAAALWGRALRSALAHEPETELFGPQPAQGNPRLREAIAEHLRASRGMAADPADIVVGAGAQVLYVLIAQLLGRGRVVAVEDPGYPTLARVYGACGLPVRHVPLDREGIRMDALRDSGADIAHIMPSHQFPTGRVTSIARRYELLAWAAQEPGRFIVEDDYDREFRLAGLPIPPLASIDAQGSVIYVSTFSKSLSSALRMAYLVLPAPLTARFAETLGFYASTLSAIDQVTLARLFESGEYERHLNRYRKQQRDTRNALIAAIRQSRLGSISRIEEADSGLHFVLALDAKRPEEEIARAGAEAGVVLAPLSRYLHEAANAPAADGRRRFVMQYEGLDASKIPPVIAALERAAEA